jgi:DNA-binding NtrC family response regulator
MAASPPVPVRTSASIRNWTATVRDRAQACLRHRMEGKVLAAEFQGNVRERQNVIERAVVASNGPVIGPEHLIPAQSPGRPDEVLTPILDLPFDEAVAALEKTPDPASARRLIGQSHGGGATPEDAAPAAVLEDARP